MHARGSLSLAVQGASLIQNEKSRGTIADNHGGQIQSVACDLPTIVAANRALQTIPGLIVDTHCR
jgi:hypothetical protein